MVAVTVHSDFTTDNNKDQRDEKDKYRGSGTHEVLVLLCPLRKGLSLLLTPVFSSPKFT